MSSNICTFECDDCGALVHAFGLSRPPDPPRCSICEWLALVPDQYVREGIRMHLDMEPRWESRDYALPAP